jgi:tetratricopeptide (TPR) repeat protein
LTSLNNLGEVNRELGRYEKAHEYYKRVLDMSRELRDSWRELKVLNELGNVSNRLNQRTEALAYYKLALNISRESGNRSGEGSIMKNIGDLYFEQGRFDVALAFFLLAKEKLEEIQSPDFDKVQRVLEGLSENIGERQFEELLTNVEPQTHKMVEQALSTEINENYA